MQRTNNKKKASHDILIALEHVREGVLHLRLNLVLVHVLEPAESNEHVRERSQSVEQHEEDDVMVVKDLIWFVSRVSKP